MLEAFPRLFLRTAIIVAVVALMGMDSAWAAKSKPANFDISAAQFKEDCELAGGTFDAEGGVYSCLFDDWHMECTKNGCRIYCDPGTPCVKSRRIHRVKAALQAMAPVVQPPTLSTRE